MAIMSAPADQVAPRAVRPKLRLDSVLIETPDGAFLRNGTTSCVIRGRTSYRWLATLSPHLDGRRTMEEICAGLDPERRSTVVHLVESLLARGFAKDAGDPEPDGLLPAEVDRYFHRQLEFIDHHADRPRQRFRDFRDARVLLAGSGEALLAAATGLLRNGLATLNLASGAAAETYRDALRVEVDALRAHGVACEVRPDGSDDPPSSGYDAFIYCDDDGDPRRVLELNRRCWASGPLFLPVVLAHGQAVIGPVVRRGEAPCWLCAQLRLTANADAATAATHWRGMAVGGSVGARVSPLVARMIGNAAAFELFRLLTGVLPGDVDGAVVIQDLQTLEVSRETLLAHPLCPVCRPAAWCRAIEEDAEAETPVTGSGPERPGGYQRLIGRHVGLVAEFSDEPLEQVPLRTARLRMAHASPTGADRECTTVAFAVGDLMDARVAAIRLAVRDYAGQVADRPDVVVATAAELAAAGAHPVPADRLDIWSGLPFDPRQRMAWLPAVDLGSGAARPVPAAAALPLSSANHSMLVEQTNAGAAVGASREDVVAAGLTMACAYSALRDLVRSAGVAVPLDDHVLNTDETLAFLDRSARRLSRAAQVFELPGASPAHAAIAIVDGESDDEIPLWTVGAGLTAREAVLTALRDVVGVVQLRHFHGIAAGAVTRPLADFDPRSGFRRGGRMDSRYGGEPGTVRLMLDELQRRRWSALFIDTTTPDIRASRMVAGSVVLCRPPTDGVVGTPQTEAGSSR